MNLFDFGSVKQGLFEGFPGGVAVWLARSVTKVKTRKAQLVGWSWMGVDVRSIRIMAAAFTHV